MLVISASVTLLVQAIAAELGIEQALGIDVEMADGGYSGVIAGTPSYQQGKVTRLAQWRRRILTILAKSLLYRFDKRPAPVPACGSRAVGQPVSAAAGSQRPARLAGAGVADRITRRFP